MSDMHKGLPAGLSIAVSDAGSTKIATALEPGLVYAITASAPTHVVLAVTGGAAATTDFLLGTGQVLEVVPPAATLFLHGICPTGGSGSLHAVRRTRST